MLTITTPRRHAATVSVLTLLAALLSWTPPAAGEDDHAHHHHSMQSMHSMPEDGGAARTVAAYALPKVSLVRADGATVSFPADIDSGQPVILNFIYTTCTTICPVMTQIFAGVQQRLGSERDRVLMVSVSIDPEEDTPPRLAAYAKKFGAGPHWRFYTGTQRASVDVQRAFAIYRGDKMNHVPVTFLRAAPGQPWVRLDGFATPDEILREYRRLVTQS